MLRRRLELLLDFVSILDVFMSLSTVVGRRSDNSPVRHCEVRTVPPDVNRDNGV